MATHLECLGFEVNSLDEFTRLMKLTARKGKPVFSRKGTYWQWNIGNGVTLIASMDKTGKLTGLTPHYISSTTQVVGLVKCIPNPLFNMEGGFKAWAKPNYDLRNSPSNIFGDYPFIFDSPTFDWESSIQLPVHARIQLIGFAHSLETHKDSTRGTKSKVAQFDLDEEFFIPTSTFQESAKDIVEPTASFGGKVLACEKRINPYTSKAYYVMNVQTYSMVLDVLLPDEVISRNIEPGDFFSGSFWLSGTILEVVPPQGAKYVTE